MGIISIGESNYTISSTTEENLKENTINYLNNRIDFGGGIAGNVAFLLGKWGIETYIASMIGADEYGSKIKKEYESIQIKTDYLETNYEIPTILSLETYNEKQNIYTQINISKSKQLMKKADFKIVPELIFSDGYDYGASAKIMNLNLKVESVLAVTTDNPEVRELCKHCTYLVFTKIMAEHLTGTKVNYDEPTSLVKIYASLQEKYPNAKIIIALEEQGCLYAVNNEIKILPSIKGKMITKGNYISVFCGAFLYGLLKKFTLEKALMYANIAGTLAMGKPGNRLFTPILKDVLTMYNEKFPMEKKPETKTEAPETL